MHRMVIGLAFSLLATCAAAATPPREPAPLDPDWPCQQIEIDHMSLAQVWAGPSLTPYLDTWQNHPKAAALAQELAQRRVPIDAARADITSFAKAAGAQRQPELLAFFAGLFSLLDQERFEVVEGLDRFGRRQKSYAGEIRQEIADLHQAQDADHPDAAKVKTLANHVYWDTRVFKSRTQMISYACFVPDAIEQRLFALAQTTSSLLP
jgi:hypothetical protein